MSRGVILPVILGIAVLGFIGFSQDAEAVTMTFTDNTTISSDSTINNGETWTINPDVTLTINARITNHGKVVNLGTVLNNDDFENHLDGKIDNKGEIVQTGDIHNVGIINNFDGSTFTVFDNVDISPGGKMNNFSGSLVIINDQIQNNGIINNFVGATITINPNNDGLWNLSGTVNNFGTIINNHIFQNSRIISNLNNFCGSTFLNNGVVDNFGGITGGNIIDNGIVNNEDGSVFQDECEANLFVSAETPLDENHFIGPTVIEVAIVDPNIDDINIPRGEPDVTVNGKSLRMVQAVDSNWYGYFADREQAQLADETVEVAGTPGVGTDFGTFCPVTTDIGISIHETRGIAVPGTSSGGVQGTDNIYGSLPCVISSDDNLNVIDDEKQINLDENVENGQIGINPNSWPFIQLYDFNPSGVAVVHYNKGGGTQTVELTFDGGTPDKICDGETISSGTFNSITVLGGSTCVIQNVTVLKNIKVLSTQFVQISDSIIEGDIMIKNSFGGGSIYISDSTINKNVKMTQSDHTSISLFESTVGKNLILKDQIIGEIHIAGSHIGHDIQIKNNNMDGDLELESSIILGKTDIKNNIGHERIALEFNTFGKNLKISENDVDDSFEVTLNSIEGKLDIKNNNLGDLEVGENTIEKDLKISNNQMTAGLSVYDNTVNKKIHISKNQMSQFWIIDNISNSQIKVNNNDIDRYFACQNNLPVPDLKKNTFAGQDFNECTIVGNT